MRLRWKIAFAASLLVNALLVGYVVGDLSRPVDLVRVAARFSEHYPPAIRARVREEGRAALSGMRDELMALGAARDRVIVLLRAPEPDRAAIAAAQAEMRRLIGTVQARLQEATTDAVLEAPASERALIETPRPPMGW